MKILVLFITSLLGLSVLTAQSHNAVVIGQDVVVSVKTDTIVFYDAVVAFRDSTTILVESPMSYTIVNKDAWYTVYKEDYHSIKGQYVLYTRRYEYTFWVKRDQKGQIVSFQYNLFNPPTTVAGSIERWSY